MSSRLIAPERVLPTLNADGTRRAIDPQPYDGKLVRARRVTAWLLMVLFAAAPFVRIGGKPLILLDVAHREFTLFGRTFLATDGVLLMLLLLTVFVGIVWLTALFGRAWCGWGCPQTVYMEFLFRPIERLIEGDRVARERRRRQGGGGARKLLKHAVFLALAALIANLFLSYFVGPATLLDWVQRSPLEHPGPFAVMAVTTGLAYFDFAWFREQMCTVACPYARLQSVLLDPQSLIVGYDARRGEPRVKGKPRAGSGDCIDCLACVKTCPSGIDIRDGLQLECINCAQCIDACNGVMRKIGKPEHLIRYTSQLEQETGQRAAWLRPRVLIYGALFAALLAALIVAGRRGPAAEVTVLRGTGAPYVYEPAGVRSQIRLKIVNRTERAAAYRIELLGLSDGQVVVPQNPFRVPARGQGTTTLFTTTPVESFRGTGQRQVTLRVSDGQGFEAELPHRILGPMAPPRGGS